MSKIIKVLVWVISFGLVLFPVNNYILGIQYGIRPADVAIALVFIGCLGIIFLDFGVLKKINWWYFFPVLVVVGSILLRIFLGWDYTNGLLLSLCFVLLFLVSRKYQINKLFPYAVIIEAVSVIVIGILTIRGVNNPAAYFSGGIITTAGFTKGNPTYSANYDLAVGYMVFGTLLSDKKWQPYLWMLVLPAVFFTGAIEGIYIVGGLFLIMFFRHDYDKRYWITIVSTSVIAVLWMLFGTGVELWLRMSFPFVQSGGTLTSQHEFTWRIQGYIKAFKEINLFGHGYIIDTSDEMIAHNVPLIIIQQVGIFAGIAWLFALIYAFVKSHRVYLWSGIILMSLFDHYIWTSIAMWFWVALGMSGEKKVNGKIYGLSMP